MHTPLELSVCLANIIHTEFILSLLSIRYAMVFSIYDYLLVVNNCYDHDNKYTLICLLLLGISENVLGQENFGESLESLNKSNIGESEILSRILPLSLSCTHF